MVKYSVLVPPNHLKCYWPVNSKSLQHLALRAIYITTPSNLTPYVLGPFPLLYKGQVGRCLSHLCVCECVCDCVWSQPVLYKEQCVAFKRLGFVSLSFQSFFPNKVLNVSQAKVYQYEYLLSFSSIPGKDAPLKPTFQDGDGRQLCLWGTLDGVR